jgi:hypothetical protein
VRAAPSHWGCALAGGGRPGGAPRAPPPLPLVPRCGPVPGIGRARAIYLKGAVGPSRAGTPSPEGAPSATSVGVVPGPRDRLRAFSGLAPRSRPKLRSAGHPTLYNRYGYRRGHQE